MQHIKKNHNTGCFQPYLRTALSLTLAIATLASGTDALACATCGCSLSSDAAMGYSTNSGWSASLEYSFIDQNQYRHGTGTVSVNDVYNNVYYGAPGGQEVENQTINRYLTLGIGYALNANWNFRMLAPYVDRSHSTWGQNPAGDPSTLSGASVDTLGDVKFIASYQGFLATHNLGVQFGVKLPTGDYGGQNPNTGVVVGRNPLFFSGTTNLLDTSLQAGNGSTDLILGGYYFKPVSQNFDAFINGQFQFSVAQHLDNVAAGLDYRPGNITTISAGTRYMADPAMTPQLQFNYTYHSPDTGTLADPIDVKGQTLFLSPGVTLPVAHNMHLYGFVQLPVWSNLSGYQLFPHYTATLGASYHF